MGNFEDIKIVGIDDEACHGSRDSQQFFVYYDLSDSPTGDWIQQFQSAVRPYLKDHIQVKISGSQMMVSGTLGAIRTLENQISAPLEATNKAIRTLLVKQQMQEDDKKRQLSAFLETSKFAK